MKKFLSILLILILIPSLFIGCSSRPNPEDTVISFFNDFISGNYETLTTFFQGSSYEEYFDLSMTQLETEDKELYQLMFGNLEYEIIDSSIDGDSAIVKTNITNINYSVIFPELFMNLMAKAMEIAFSGEEMSQEETDKLFINMIIEKLNEEDIPKLTTTVDINLVYEEDKWVIVPNDSLANGLTGGLLDAAEQYEMK